MNSTEYQGTINRIAHDHWTGHIDGDTVEEQARNLAREEGKKVSEVMGAIRGAFFALENS